jgi:hypothetical protein
MTGHDDRGAADVCGLILIVPVVFGVVLLLVFIGRQGAATEGSAHAAHVAAVATAQAAADDTAAATLAAAGTACAGGPQVTVTADRWAAGGKVTVTVTCAVDEGDLGPLAVPARSATGTSRAVIDTYRGFSP